jgi:hypothetical protein
MKVAWALRDEFTDGRRDLQLQLKCRTLDDPFQAAATRNIRRRIANPISSTPTQIIRTW